MIPKFLSLLFAVLTFTSGAQEDSLSKANRLRWFSEAKLGIFVHWGIYAVNGIDESWSFFNEYISHDDYLKQTKGFTASKYQPEKWAEIIKQSGARYAVITSRHHDGFSLWNTKFGHLNAYDHSAAGRDVLTPFVNELRKKRLKVGIYYSLPDWSHQDYPNLTRNIKRYEGNKDKWQKYLNYYQGQIHELQSNYNPDLWWFDGDWEFDAEQWEAKKVREMLLKANPSTILNSRLQGYGDYDTPEQGLPVLKPDAPVWELCMTMNDSWGYQHNDNNYKTPYQIIRIFADVISNGGNLLLDIGPKADGTIPKEQVSILETLGVWTNKHSEAIFKTKAGLPPGYFYGPSTLSQAGGVLYLFVPHKPNGPIVVKGIKNKINRIRIVGNGTKLSHVEMMKQYWSPKPGILYINVPDQVLDDYVTVIAIQLNGPLDLDQ